MVACFASHQPISLMKLSLVYVITYLFDAYVIRSSIAEAKDVTKSPVASPQNAYSASI
jgi:hypothetical protein